MAQQTQQSKRDMERIGALLYQLKTEATTLCTAILESTNNNVRSQLTQILNKSFQNQKIVFDCMNQKGWYKVEPAPQDQYTRIQQSFTTLQQQVQGQSKNYLQQ
ncbi:MAG TPA: spore coat protein [Methylomusa anaerophila]|uniref:Coat F domain protein n=1 Tax=Methylomusa anaerophila TaxID=1930071 RepID=A0A348AL57_9FIRM|nr:spore coat protein [Methylomusa anaerophila]BBB91805.1 coat F domain protein [Methylomusa anaerophila]HML88461.1 spore coat protein [Methylomusa anaerophila]